MATPSLCFLTCERGRVAADDPYNPFHREMSSESLGEARSAMQTAVDGQGDRHPDGTGGTSRMDAPGARDGRASAPQKEEGVEGLPEGTQLSCPGRFKRISKAEKRRKDAKKRGAQAEAGAAGRAGRVEPEAGCVPDSHVL